MERSSIRAVEPLLSLAFAMHSNRGVYALLLGSGVSRAAAIPTGWEVVLDLVRKLAALKGESCDADPEAWFAGVFGEAPTYGGLLKKLCKTPAGRQQLLRSYFEPSAHEEAVGPKQPTQAHHAIAALVKSGHVRVILTTNFDRLIERSLEAAGVSPIVISTADGVDGALPLAHAACTVVKLHGDYLDARIRNTAEELAQYDRRFVRLLDRVFDEYGLVVCGWSAEWDEALRQALIRCKSRRFTTYWAVRGEPKEAARAVIEHRNADVIRVADADRFFGELHQKVEALASFDPPHPLSAKTAVATMKRLLSDERHRIELHDLVMNEVERIMLATSDDKMPVSGAMRPTVDAIRNRMKEYETLTSILQSLVITGCFWAGPGQEYLWKSALERLANRPTTGGVTFLIGLRRYPALLMFYAGGISAVAAMNMHSLRALLLAPRFRSDNGEGPVRPALEHLYANAVIDTDAGRQVLPGAERLHTPSSDYLFALLREPLRQVLPSDQDYESAFDKFEYFLALLTIDRNLTDENKGAWAPVGRFGWKGKWRGGPEIFEKVEQEALAAGDGWPPVTAGLFTSVERFRSVAAVVANNVKQIGWH